MTVCDDPPATQTREVGGRKQVQAKLQALEVCAGAGGQALGLEQAGFGHAVLIENDRWACETLRANRPRWKVAEQDVKLVDGKPFAGIDLLSGGVPCPPFSVAGRQLGANDERDLFPEMIRLAAEVDPRAVMIENVRGILGLRFDGYRRNICSAFERLGYTVFPFRLLQASDFGVPQLRPRAVFVALKEPWASAFAWPEGSRRRPKTVGETLRDAVAVHGWERADEWAGRAARIAPTLCGGSKLHGGPDLGPTRARRAWAELAVDGLVLADRAPRPGDKLPIRLTVEMTALLQGFPPQWVFQGPKTHRYRQVGNAFPPPVAKAVAKAIKAALESAVDTVVAR
jgi:DNA (cytosine-5)-methyltransferase 1